MWIESECASCWLDLWPTMVWNGLARAPMSRLTTRFMPSSNSISSMAGTWKCTLSIRPGTGSPS